METDQVLPTSTLTDVPENVKLLIFSWLQPNELGRAGLIDRNTHHLVYISELSCDTIQSIWAECFRKDFGLVPPRSSAAEETNVATGNIITSDNITLPTMDETIMDTTSTAANNDTVDGIPISLYRDNGLLKIHCNHALGNSTSNLTNMNAANTSSTIVSKETLHEWQTEIATKLWSWETSLLESKQCLVMEQPKRASATKQEYYFATDNNNRCHNYRDLYLTWKKLPLNPLPPPAFLMASIQSFQKLRTWIHSHLLCGTNNNDENAASACTPASASASASTSSNTAIAIKTSKVLLSQHLLHGQKITLQPNNNNNNVDDDDDDMDDDDDNPTNDKNVVPLSTPFFSKFCHEWTKRWYTFIQRLKNICYNTHQCHIKPSDINDYTTLQGLRALQAFYCVFKGQQDFSELASFQDLFCGLLGGYSAYDYKISTHVCTLEKAIDVTEQLYKQYPVELLSDTTEFMVNDSSRINHHRKCFLAVAISIFPNSRRYILVDLISPLCDVYFMTIDGNRSFLAGGGRRGGPIPASITIPIRTDSNNTTTTTNANTTTNKNVRCQGLLHWFENYVNKIHDGIYQESSIIQPSAFQQQFQYTIHYHTSRGGGNSNNSIPLSIPCGICLFPQQNRLGDSANSDVTITTTRGIQVTVSTIFMVEVGFWTYSIRIGIITDPNTPGYLSPKERGYDYCQLTTRHWIIENNLGHVQHVRGPGVVGYHPLLFPGGYRNDTDICSGGEVHLGNDFVYQSCTGQMEGNGGYFSGELNFVPLQLVPSEDAMMDQEEEDANKITRDSTFRIASSTTTTAESGAAENNAAAAAAEFPVIVGRFPVQIPSCIY